MKAPRKAPKKSLKAKAKPGPVPGTLVIEGMKWTDAMKKALTKKKPAKGWPK